MKCFGRHDSNSASCNLCADEVRCVVNSVENIVLKKHVSLNKEANTLKAEEELLKDTANLCNKFLKLDKQHPDEQRNFADGIHKIQDVIAMRFARDSRPDLFPVKK